MSALRPTITPPLKLLDERLQVRPTPDINASIFQSSRKRWTILVDIHKHDWLFLVVSALDLPKLAVGFGRVLRDQANDPVATLNPAAAVCFPFFVPRFLGRHIRELERRFVELRLSGKKVTIGFVLYGECNKNTLAHVCSFLFRTHAAGSADITAQLTTKNAFQLLCGWARALVAVYPRPTW